MSLEAIKQFTQAEQSWTQRKAEAVLAAKMSVADAEAKARIQADQVQAETARSCQALKTSAQQKLEAAAELIVRRVVNLS